MTTYTPPPPPAPALENPVDVRRVRNYESYRARIVDINPTRSRPEFGNEKQFVVDFELFDSDGVALGNARTWLSPRFGLNQQTGQVSKMTAFLNALASQKETTVVAWFNDEEGDERGEQPLAWGYDSTRTPYLALRPGLEVNVRGKIAPRSDGQGEKYRIEVFEPVEAAKPSPAASTETRAQAPAATRLAPEEPDPDEIPF